LKIVLSVILLDTLLVAPECSGSVGDTFATRTGQQHVAATEEKGIRRTQTSLERLAFFLAEWAHKEWLFQKVSDTTFAIIFLENALVHNQATFLGMTR
jgi:hypothetical protein